MQTEREQNDPKLFRTAARFIASPTVGGRRYWSDEVGEDKAGLLRVAASSLISQCAAWLPCGITIAKGGPEFPPGRRRLQPCTHA